MTMHDGDESWAEGGRGEERQRPPLLIAAVGLPWLVVVALLLVGRGDGPTEPSAAAERHAATEHGLQHAGTSAPHDHGHHPDTAGAPLPADPSVVTPGTLAGATTQRRIQAATAAATAVARSWITGIEPHLDIEGLTPAGEPWYVEHLAVETVDVHADMAVVTFLAIVLDTDDERLAAHLRRVAVPMLLHPRSQPAGSPWWLPEPRWSMAPPESHLVDDATVLSRANDALLRAGYRDTRLLQVRRSEVGYWFADIEATTPESQRVDSSVVLYPVGDGFVVGGASHLDGTGSSELGGAIAPSHPPAPAPVDREGGR